MGVVAFVIAHLSPSLRRHRKDIEARRLALEDLMRQQEECVTIRKKGKGTSLDKEAPHGATGALRGTG